LFHCFFLIFCISSLDLQGKANLAFCYERGYGIEQNPKKAFKLYSKCLKYPGSHLPTTLYHLGSYYEKGWNNAVIKDERKAFSFYYLAATYTEGNKKILRYLNDSEIRNKQSRSSSHDLNDSSVFTFITLDSSPIPMLSESPHLHPMHPLSSSSILLPSLSTSNKTSPDSSSSSSSTTPSGCGLTSVCPAAEYKVAYCYEHGIGMEESNEEEAIKWYERASNSGYLPASYHLGLYYSKKPAGIPKSLEFFQLSALKGYAPSQTVLASCYEEGKILPKMDNLAFSLYYKAAKQGYPLAQYRLARCYEKNIGIPDLKSRSTMSVSFRASSRSLSSYLRDSSNDLCEMADLPSVNLQSRRSKRREKEERNNNSSHNSGRRSDSFDDYEEEKSGLSVSDDFEEIEDEEDDNVSEASHNSYLQKPTKRIPEMLKWYKIASQNGCLDATKALIRLTH
jgi:TPR repeat protein